MKRPKLQHLLDHFLEQAQALIDGGHLPEDCHGNEDFDLLWVYDEKTNTHWEIHPTLKEHTAIMAFINAANIHEDEWPMPSYTEYDGEISRLPNDHTVADLFYEDLEVTHEDLGIKPNRNAGLDKEGAITRLLKGIKKDIDIYESETTEEDTEIILGLLTIIQQIRDKQ
jgi:hypothetical protein